MSCDHTMISVHDSYGKFRGNMCDKCGLMKWKEEKG